MTLRFDCGRAEELLSDHVEGTLDPLLAADLEAHLGACEECRGLREALAEVLEVLRRPLEMEPGPGLAERIAAAAWRSGRRPAQVALARHIPVRVHAAAAAFAIATSAGLFLLGASPGSSPAREVPFSVRMTEARDSLIETRDRVVEDYHILRVLVGTVFEGRLDRVGERVEDYRKLLERRNRPSAAPKKSEGPGVGRVLWSDQHLLNSAPPRPVKGGERRAVRATLSDLPHPCKGAC